MTDDKATVVGFVFIVAGFALMGIACFVRDWMVFAFGAVTVWTFVKGIE